MSSPGTALKPGQGLDIYYVDFVPKNLSKAQKAAILKLQKYVNKLFGKWAEKAQENLNADARSQGADPATLASLRAWHTIQVIMKSSAPDLNINKVDINKDDLEVKSQNFHEDLIRLAAKGFDMPVPEVAPQLETLIQNIKLKISSGATGSSSKRVSIIGNIYSYDDLGVFRASMRVLEFEVDSKLSEVASNKSTTSITTLHMEFLLADFSYEHFEEVDEGETTPVNEKPPIDNRPGLIIINITIPNA